MHHGGGRISPQHSKEERVSRPGTLRRVAVFFKPYWRQIAVAFVAILVIAGLGLINPYLLKLIIDDAIPSGDLTLLNIFVGLMIVVPIVSGLIGVGQSYLNNLVGQHVMRDLRNALYAHLQHMPLRFFTATRTGEIQSRLSNDVGGVQQVVTNTASGIVSNIATALSTIVVMAFIDVRLTIISLAIAPVFLLITRRVGAIRREISKLTQQSMANLTATTQETLSVSGVLLTKTFGRQSEAISRFSNENESLAALEIRQQMIGRWFFMIISVFFSITPAIVYLVAGRAIIGGGTDITIGGIVAFTTLQSRLFMPLGQLLNLHVDVQGALALFDRIFEYLDMEHEITDRPGAITLEPATVRGDVVYDHVSFQYDVPIDTEDAETTDQANRLALDDININIKASQLVALVGPSGAGKTTLTYLLPRLYDVTGGAIRIDGHDVRDIRLESLGEIIGFVTQETYLFHSSIRDNLAYGLPNATDAELEAAARAAAIHERIAELPDGYDTIVGERGYKMSGGEKQRLALARVILKDPRILILDEATSALDTHSERLIQNSLETLMQDRTTIAIAHRLSTILAADQILVIDAGRVVESGTHSELIATSGLYASLYHEQFSNADRREHELATFS
ncbi:ABC transporter ATP-binding protein [soil metagenome]